MSEREQDDQLDGEKGGPPYGGDRGGSSAGEGGGQGGQSGDRDAAANNERTQSVEDQEGKYAATESGGEQGGES